MRPTSGLCRNRRPCCFAHGHMSFHCYKPKACCPGCHRLWHLSTAREEVPVIVQMLGDQKRCEPLRVLTAGPETWHSLELLPG